MRTPKLVITAGKLFVDSSSLEEKLDDIDILIHLNQDMSEDFSLILDKRIKEKWNDNNVELTFSMLKVNIVLDCSTVTFDKNILARLYQAIEISSQKFEKGIKVAYHLYYKDSQYKREEKSNLSAFSDFAKNVMPQLYKIDAVAKLYSDVASTNKPISQEQSIAQIFETINFSGTTAALEVHAGTPFEVSMITQSKIISQSYTEQIQDNVLRLVNAYVEKKLESSSNNDAEKILENLNSSLNDFIDKYYLAVMSGSILLSSKQAKNGLISNGLPYSLREAEKQLFGLNISNLFEQRVNRIPKSSSREELIDATLLDYLLLHETAFSVYECAEVSKLLSKALQNKSTALTKSIATLEKKVEEELESANFKSHIDVSPVKSFMKIDKRKTSEKIFNEVQMYLYSHVYEARVEIIKEKIQIQLIEQLQNFLIHFNEEMNAADLGLYDYKKRHYDNKDLNQLLQESLLKSGEIASEYLTLVKSHFEIPFDKKALKSDLLQDIQKLPAVKSISKNLLTYLISEIESKDRGASESVKKIVKTIVSELIKETEKPIRLYTNKGANWESYSPTTRVAIYYTEDFAKLLDKLDEKIDFANAETNSHSNHIFSNVIVHDLKLDDLFLYKLEKDA